MDGREGIPGMPGGKVSCVSISVMKTINIQFFYIFDENMIALVMYYYLFVCREVLERLEYLGRLDFRDFL